MQLLEVFKAHPIAHDPQTPSAPKEAHPCGSSVQIFLGLKLNLMLH